MIPLRNSSPATPGFLHRGITRCLLGLGSLAAFSSLPARAQYAEWTATPPKILPKERLGSGTAFAGGSGRQCPNVAAFAALKPDGSIVAWGSSDAGGSGAPVGTGFTALHSNERAFAALKADGSITAWGHADQGGSGAPTGTGFTAVYSTREAFAALKADGSITAWGNPSYGGNNAPTDKGYVSLYSTYFSFAALKADGSITAWGNSTYGGSGAPAGTGFTAVYPNSAAFAALKEDGSISTWGNGGSGGTGAPSGTGFTAVYSTAHAFAALKTVDGTISAWGSSSGGGVDEPTDGGFIDVYSTNNAFAAVKGDDRSITVWGQATSGGSGAPTGGGFTAVYSNGGAFAALSEDGTITAWGDPNCGASSEPAGSGYTAIYSNPAAFAALKEDGSVSAWGNSGWGGSGAPTGRLFTSVYSTYFSFAALKSDGSISTWGNVSSGGSGGPSGAGFTSLQSVSAIEPLAIGAAVSASTGSMTSTTATLGGEVVREGLEPVTERGFVYALATVTNPTIGDDGVTQLVDGSGGVGTFSATISGLTSNTVYVFKSYVIDADGTTYSKPVNFSTNLSPVLTSNGGNSTAAVPVAENSSAVTTVSATDADAGQTITYSIAGGADAARFEIGAASGALTFVAAPDFEAPEDADDDNVYQVVVTATDNGNTPKSATQTVDITVTNLADNGELVLERPDGTGLASGDVADFGSQTLGQPVDLTFTLRSVGEADLVLPDGMTFGGASASAFSLVGSFPETVATGSSITFTVRFSPIAGGSNTADLSFATNDTRAGRSPHVLNLTGSGLTASTSASYANAANQVRGGWIDGTNFTIGAVTTNWPSGESPDKVVDNNTGSKFLAFRNNNVGLILSPTNATVAFNRLSLYTANDASERDPASYVIYGSTTVLTGTSGTNLPLAGLTQLASGTIVLPDNRTTGPTVVQFANTTAYASYIVAFPTVRSTSSNTMTQISEVQLSQGINPPFSVAMTGARGGELSGSTFNFGSIGTTNPGNNWPGAESPDHALDGNVNTKFLFYRPANGGIVCSPVAGPAAVNRFTLWTANDAPQRDPIKYQVYGFATHVTQTSGSLNVGTAGTLLGSGNLTLPDARNAGPVMVEFDNSTAYASYLVVFPAVKYVPITSITQISELQFGYNGVPDFTLPTGVTTPVGEIWTARDNESERDWRSITSSADGTKLAAVAYDGQIYTSTDSGVTWTARENQREWQSIASSADGTRLAAVVYDGRIYTSIDSGENWTARESNREWQSIASSADGTKLAAVDFGGQIYTSINSGESWTARGDNRYWASISSSADGAKLAAVADDGPIYTSTNSGVNWTPRESPEGWWVSITSSADGTKLAAVIYGGQIYTSSDSGANWTARESQRDWISIASSTDGTKLAAAGHGRIYISNDSGVNWTPGESDRDWATIASSADGTKLAAGVWGGQIHTSSTFTAPYVVSVAEDSGSYSEAAFATDITPGLGDVGQTFSLASTNDNNELFSAQPVIAADGTLTFTPASNASGTATVTVIATDSTGLTSVPRSFVIEVTPSMMPSAPTSLVATAGDGQVSVAFTAGADGGSAITNYEFSTNDGTNWTALSPAVTTSPVVITGLTNGTAYSIRLRAVNAAGNGDPSEAVGATPRTVPSAPTSLVATAGDGEVSVAFTAGADGGSAITNYEFSTNNGSNWTVFSPAITTSPAVISGLTNGTAYSIRLRAVNAAGNGAASDAVSGTPRTTPSAPTSLVATAGDGQVSVAFTAGADGGSAITNYEFSTNNGTDWTAFNPPVTTSPAVITGLTNGTAYSIRLRAVNEAGSGAASDAVSTTPVDPPIVFRAAAKAAATTSISVSKMTSKARGVLGTTVTVASVAATSEQGATVALAGSAIQYTPALGFSGVDRFRVTFTSSTGTIVGLIEMTTAATSGGSGSSHLANPARLSPLSGGRMGIQFNGIPGVAYQLQRSTDLASWTTIATITAGSRGEIDFTDDNPPAPNGFYRLFKP